MEHEANVAARLFPYLSEKFLTAAVPCLIVWHKDLFNDVDAGEHRVDVIPILRRLESHLEILVPSWAPETHR